LDNRYGREGAGELPNQVSVLSCQYDFTVSLAI